MHEDAPPKPAPVAVRAAALALLGLYLATAARTLPDFEGGEFLILARTGGVAHPPGYPLYVLALRLVSMVDDDVFAFAALSAVLVAGALLIVGEALHARGAFGPAVAAVMVAVGCAPPVWRAAGGVEPFALNLLLAGVVLAAVILVDDGASPRRRRLIGFAIGLGFGLGFANHHSLATLLPGALVALASGAAWRKDGQAIAALAAGAALGTTPVLYLIRDFPPDSFCWASFDDAGALVDHLLRRQYGTLTLSANASGSAWVGPVAFARALTVGTGGLGVLFVGLGAALGLRARRWRLTTTAALLMLGFSGPLLSLLFRTGADGVERQLVERFFALPLLCALPLGAVAVDGLRRRRRWALGAVWAAAVASSAVQLPDAARVFEDFSEAHARNLLRAAGPGSVLLVHTDAETFGALYVREASGATDPPAIVSAELSAVPAMRAFERRRAPYAPFDVDSLRAHLEAGGRAFTTSVHHPLAKPFLETSHPAGPLIELRLPAEPAIPIARVFEQNRRIFDGLVWPRPFASLSPWERRLIWPYERALSAMRDMATREQRPDIARACDALRRRLHE